MIWYAKTPKPKWNATLWDEPPASCDTQHPVSQVHEHWASHELMESGQVNIQARSSAGFLSTSPNLAWPSPSCEHFHPDKCERKARENQHERLGSNKNTKTLVLWTVLNRSGLSPSNTISRFPRKKKTTPNHAPNRARHPSAQPLKHLERWRGYRALHNSPSLRHQADSHDKHQVWGTEITSDQEDHMSSRYDTNDMMICTVSTIHPITHHQIEVYLWSCIVLLIKDPTLPYSTYLSITVYLSTDQISFNSISPVCEIQSMVYQIKLNKPYHIILSLSPLYKTPKHPQHQCRLVYLHIPIYSIYIYLSIFLLPESSVVYLWSRNRSMKQSIHRINLQPI